MEDAFRAKVQAAATAAWWTFIISAAFFLLQWIVYLVVMSARPALALSAWGPGATWDRIGPAWFGALAFVKLSLWLLAVGALWLTLWARRLRARPS